MTYNGGMRGARNFLLAVVGAAAVTAGSVLVYKRLVSESGESSGTSSDKPKQFKPSDGEMAQRKKSQKPPINNENPPISVKELKEEKVSWLPGLRVREQRILDVMPLNKPVTMSDVAKFFPDVTARTLRRDMDRLVDKGRVKKTGSTRATTYVRM